MDLRRSCRGQVHQQVAGDKMRDELGEALDVGIAELDRAVAPAASHPRLRSCRS